MKIRPRKNTLLIQPETPQEREKKIGSIFIPQSHWSMHPDVRYARIVEVGDMCEDLKAGMYVIVGKLAGVSLSPEEGSMVLIAEEDVIAEVIEEGK